MLEKKFSNEDLGIQLTSYIDYKQNVWFLGKDVAKILGYSDTDKAIRRHVDEEDKYKGPAKTAGGLQLSFFINESGFYSLLLSSITIGICEKVQTLGNITSTSIYKNTRVLQTFWQPK